MNSSTFEAASRQACRSAKALCRLVAAQDLGPLPLYIVPQSRLPPELGGGSVANGYTASRLDLHLRDFIPDYRGRGPCMVVGDRNLWARDADDFLYSFQATSLHELAHLLLRPWYFCEPVNASPEALHREARKVADMVATEPPEDGLPPFMGHESQFIRTALHLQHRAAKVGVWIAPNDLCAGRQYGLSHARRYQLALGDEPQRLADKPIMRIVATEAPIEFTELWVSDVRAHLQSFSRMKGSAL